MVGSRHSSHLSDTPRGSWASSVFDLRNSVADPLLPSLLSRIPLDTVDNNNQQSRQENRQVLYHLITYMYAIPWIYVYDSACLFICVNLSDWLYILVLPIICTCTWLFLYLSIQPVINMFFHPTYIQPTLYLFVYLFVCQFIFQSIWSSSDLFFCISVCLSICF